MIVEKIISGGQTGVDQAALQAAIDLGIVHGGWCPPGRICETGIIPEKFKLIETPDEREVSALDIPRSQRTIWNVRDSDGVLIIKQEQSDKGSKVQRDFGTPLAIDTAKKFDKPYFIIDYFDSETRQKARNWLTKLSIKILNVAGPSERTSLGIYEKTYSVMNEILR